MTGSKNDFRPMVPADPDGANRVARQARLGLKPEPDDVHDAFAAEARQRFGGMMAGVNLVGEDCWQYFIGFSKRDDLGPVTEADRVMDKEHGYCAVMITERTSPLAINTKSHPRWSTNPVAQYFGVESYMGVELYDEDGAPWGTVWVVDDVEHDWKQSDIDWMKDLGHRVETYVNERCRQSR